MILARHGESVFSERRLLNGDVSVPGPLTHKGKEEARELGRRIAGDALDLCVTSEFERTRQTADIALEGRDPRRLVVPELNDPRYGSYEGGALEDYRAWAASSPSSSAAPGGGESRAAIVERYARGFRLVLERPEESALVVIHSLPIAYAIAARVGTSPGPRVPLVEHAQPYRFSADDLEDAVELLEAWISAPTW